MRAGVGTGGHGALGAQRRFDLLVIGDMAGVAAVRVVNRGAVAAAARPRFGDIRADGDDGPDAVLLEERAHGGGQVAVGGAG